MEVGILFTYVIDIKTRYTLIDMHNIKHPKKDMLQLDLTRTMY